MTKAQWIEIGAFGLAVTGVGLLSQQAALLILAAFALIALGSHSNVIADWLAGDRARSRPNVQPLSPFAPIVQSPTVGV